MGLDSGLNSQPHKVEMGAVGVGGKLIKYNLSE